MPWRYIGGVDVYLHMFLTLALDGGETVSHPGHCTPGIKTPGTHWIGGWVDPRASLDAPAENWTLVVEPVA